MSSRVVLRRVLAWAFIVAFSCFAAGFGCACLVLNQSFDAQYEAGAD